MAERTRAFILAYLFKKFGKEITPFYHSKLDYIFVSAIVKKGKGAGSSWNQALEMLRKMRGYLGELGLRPASAGCSVDGAMKYAYFRCPWIQDEEATKPTSGTESRKAKR